jgi:hypothetical protein
LIRMAFALAKLKNCFAFFLVLFAHPRQVGPKPTIIRRFLAFPFNQEKQVDEQASSGQTSPRTNLPADLVPSSPHPTMRADSSPAAWPHKGCDTVTRKMLPIWHKRTFSRGRTRHYTMLT